MSELWEKQENETYHSYQRFCIYRDLGIMRSLKKVNEKMNKGSNYIRALQILSKKYKWHERAIAYDLYVEEQNRKENELEIKEMKKRHIQQSLLMQKSVIEKIQNANVNEMSLSDCIKMFDVAVKVERLSRDCDSAKVEVNNNVVVDSRDILEQKKLDKLSPEELEELERLIRKTETDEE